MMETIKLPLLSLLSFIAVTAVIAYSPSSSGSASGDFRFTEQECKVPPYSDPSNIEVNPTDDEREEILKEGRCYLACTAEKYQVPRRMHDS